MNNSKIDSAQTGLCSALLYMYVAYKEECNLSSEEAGEKVKNVVLNELNKLNVDTTSNTLISNNKPFLINEIKKNVNVLKGHSNTQINYIGKSIEFALEQLVGNSKLK